MYQINDYQSPFSTMCVQPEDIFILRMKSIQLNTCDTFSEQCLIVWSFGAGCDNIGIDLLLKILLSFEIK